MSKTFRKIHLWLSLPAGLLLIILCLTGAVLVFQTEIQKAANPTYYHVKSSNEHPIPTDSLLQIGWNILEGRGKTMSSASFYKENGQTVEFGAKGQKGSVLALNPYTGEIMGEEPPLSGFFKELRSLHRWLMFSGEGVFNRQLGRTIMGASSLFLVVILISGLSIRFPKNRKQWKQQLTPKRGKKSRVWWLTSHCAFGFYTVIFLILMAVTGPMWSFNWYNTGVRKLFNIAEGPGRHAPPKDKQKGKQREKEKSPDTAVWSQALRNIQKEAPNYTRIRIEEQSASVQTTKHKHIRANDTYPFDEQGNITEVTPYTQLPSSKKYMGYAYIIHTGMFGGLFTQILYFIACLGGVYLTVSGYVLYGKRIGRRGRGKRYKEKDEREKGKVKDARPRL